MSAGARSSKALSTWSEQGRFRSTGLIWTEGQRRSAHRPSEAGAMEIRTTPDQSGLRLFVQTEQAIVVAPSGGRTC